MTSRTVTIQIPEQILLAEKTDADTFEPTITILEQNGMWISTKVRQRILRLAGEMK